MPNNNSDLQAIRDDILKESQLFYKQRESILELVSQIEVMNKDIIGIIQDAKSEIYDEDYDSALDTLNHAIHVLKKYSDREGPLIS